MEFGFPEITDSFLAGQNLFYSQFNDVEFYVEDIDQENFYFEILKKLFPDVKFDKIFPLGGKVNIQNDADLNIGIRNKVYFLDLDFDEILCNKKSNKNIFYLRKYSIENYLLEEAAIRSIIKEEKPKLKDLDIKSLFDHNMFLDECRNLFSELICHYLVIQKYGLGIENVGLDTSRFCSFNVMPSSIRTPQLEQYSKQIEITLKSKRPKMKLETQIRSFKKHFKTTNIAIRNIPGKYILNLLKYRIEYLFSITRMNLESFSYRLVRNCEFYELEYIKIAVNNFLKP